MFAPVDSWTLPSHLFLVSEWSAACSNPTDPMSCHTDINLGDPSLRWDYGKKPVYAWTDLTWLMDEQHVAWRYYVGNDTCEEPPCPSTGRKFYGTSYNRNPLPGFSSFGERQGEGGSWKDNVLPSTTTCPRRPTARCPTWHGSRRRRTSRTTPADPARPHRDGVRHPAGERGDAGPDWDSTAIFLTWDDWGGFYDHVVPERFDAMGYGLRVPGLVISPWAKRGTSTTRSCRSTPTRS